MGYASNDVDIVDFGRNELKSAHIGGYRCAVRFGIQKAVIQIATKSSPSARSPGICGIPVGLKGNRRVQIHRCLGLLILLLLSVLVPGCAFTTDKIELSYNMRGVREKIADAEAVKFEVKITDNRRDRERMGRKINGYGKEMGALVSTTDVAGLVKDACRQEESALPGNVAPDIDLGISFTNDPVHLVHRVTQSQQLRLGLRTPHANSL